MVVVIRLVGSIIAIVALVLIWKAHQYNTLWWVILVLFILDWMTAEAVRNSVKMGSGKRIENIWTVANMVTTLACFVVSIIGIVLCVNVNAKQTQELHTSSYVVKIDDETRHSIEGFFNGYEYFVSAGNLLHGMLSSQNPVEEYKKAVTLLNKSKNDLIKCDPELLDSVYSDWGDVLSNKLIPTIDIYIAGTEPNADRNKLQKGDELIIEFDAWLAKNRSELLLRLNKKFGYEIK